MSKCFKWLPELFIITGVVLMLASIAAFILDRKQVASSEPDIEIITSDGVWKDGAFHINVLIKIDARTEKESR